MCCGFFSICLTDIVNILGVFLILDINFNQNHIKQYKNKMYYPKNFYA